jgi:hypothetical protein
LCPIGDTPIRRAIFDALLSGCIPVMFRARDCSDPMPQYDWHFSPEEIDNGFVFFDASNGTLELRDFVHMLADAYSEPHIRFKQKAIASMARKLQYSMPPDVQQYGMPPISQRMQTWDPPFRDAVDVILKNLFDKVDMYVDDDDGGF